MPGPDWVEIIVRSFTLLIVLFFMTKWLTKKQLFRSNIFEYIIGICMGGNVASHLITLNNALLHGVVAIVVLFVFAAAIEFISMKSKTFRDFMQGKSTILIQDGKVMEDNMKKEGYNSDDLLENLRTKDVFRVADVEFAVLEPSGILNVLPKKESLPPTAKDLGLKLAPQKQPEVVVMDGKMLLEPLANLSLNPNWLETELDKLNVSIENVFLGQVDSDGQLTVDLFDDLINVPSPSEKPLLLATLKKCQADLELFSLGTDNEQTKQMYQEDSKKVQQAIDAIEPFLH